MSKLDTVKKVMLYQKDKSGFVKEPTISEMADLVVLVLSQVKVIEDAIKAGRLDGKTPVKDVDYISRDSAIKMLTQAVNEALNNEEDKFIGRVEGKFNSKVYQSEKTRDEAVNGAIERINQKLSEVKDGVVTEAEIRRAANIALGMIELPDFASLIKESVDGETVRDALSLLTGDKRYQVQIADVDGLADALAQVSQIRANGGGTIGKQQVYNFIRQAIADGIITSGAGTGDVVGPASAVDSNFASFNTTTGKLIKDSGSKASDFATAGHNHAGVYAPALGADDNFVTDAEKTQIASIVTKVGTPINNQVGVWTGDGTIEGDANLTFDSDTLTVTNNNDTGAATALVVQGDRATPTNNDEVIIEMKLSDSAGNQDTMGTIRAQALDVTSTSEDSQLKFGTVVAGTLASRLALTGTELRPNTDDALSLGNATANRWSDLYLAEGGVINWDNGDATLTQTGNVLELAGADLVVPNLELGHASDTTLSRVSAGVVAVEGVTVPTISSTSTFTNKRTNPRTASSTTSATLTPDLSSANIYYRTTQTEALTIGAPTGTPVIGETLLIYVDSAGAQTLTMNATYKAFGAAFPASTTAGKTLMISAQYNGTDWKTLWANAV